MHCSARQKMCQCCCNNSSSSKAGSGSGCVCRTVCVRQDSAERQYAVSNCQLQQRARSGLTGSTCFLANLGARQCCAGGKQGMAACIIIIIIIKLPN
jgi:hypothetical protein